MSDTPGGAADLGHPDLDQEAGLGSSAVPSDGSSEAFVPRQRTPGSAHAPAPEKRHRSLRVMLLLTRILSAAVTLLLIAAVLTITTLSVLTATDRVRVRQELSGSMSPAIEVDDLVVYRPVDAGRLVTGDIISVLPAGARTPVTHRVFSIDHDPQQPESLMVTTKGDANASPDGHHLIIAARQQVWTVWTVIPRAGLPIANLTGGHGIPFILGLLPLFILMPGLKRLLKNQLSDPQTLKSDSGTPKTSA